MKTSLLLSLLLLTPTEVVVREGETLSQVAQRTLGDARGASELKALNALTSETVPAGTTLRLPGPDRDRAQRTLDAARSTVGRADASAPGHPEALDKLKEAETLFQSARYEEASQAADQAWKLLANSPTQPTVLQVDVQEDGTTAVKVVSGKARLQATDGSTRDLNAGDSLRVQKDAPLPPPTLVLAVPQLLQPSDSQKMKLKPTRGGLGPVKLTWHAVQGAERYALELVPDKGERRVVLVDATEVKLPLAPGAWRWNVRAVAGESRSEPSAERRFQVAEQGLELDVKSSNWK
jgi:hypothetical protein